MFKGFFTLRMIFEIMGIVADLIGVEGCDIN